MPDTSDCEHMARTCLFAIWTLATCTAYHAHRFHLSHSVLFWAHTCKSFLSHFDASWGKSYLWCWIEWHRAQSTQASQCLGLTKPLCARAFLSPWGGRGNDVISKKKKMRMLVHCRIYLALSISMLDGCIKEIARFPPLSLYPLLCFQMHRGKKNHTREMQLLRRFTVGNGRTRYYFPAELYLLFMMDWSLQWGFLVGFCVALCFSVSRNSVLHACTAILRIVHDSDSGRASACTNFVIFYRFRRFSTFAEEGFTCLDHSMLSKKKKERLSLSVIAAVIWISKIASLPPSKKKMPTWENVDNSEEESFSESLPFLSQPGWKRNWYGRQESALSAATDSMLSTSTHWVALAFVFRLWTHLSFTSKKKVFGMKKVWNMYRVTLRALTDALAILEWRRWCFERHLSNAVYLTIVCFWPWSFFPV